MSKFLSQEWLDELTATVNAHEGFTGAVANVNLTLQFVVTDAPEGAESTYYMRVADGTAQARAGEADDADATITNDYATASAISRGELNTQMAFMTGKLKVSGNMAKLMMNQGMLTQFAAATKDMPVEY
ncbi:MAG: SCP2 sterol-binding domain-containing protein [Acidimicrobiia bacterium]|nr:MAG: SCP2 sterol-binding domain-containing protein [Acidimicrobiia bacterium]